MAEGTPNTSDVANISDFFDEGLLIFNKVSKSYEPTNSLSVQCQIKKSMGLLEETTKLVSMAGMFSTNETIEEIATSEIKFFLLPALLGTLTLKLCVANRLEVVNTAEVYFKDFLHRCKCYGIIDFDAPELEPEVVYGTDTSSTKNFNVAKMACTRNIKIQRFKEQKELERQLAELQEAMDDLNVDDEIKRNYYLTMIRSFASQAIDELDFLNSEKPLILHRAFQAESDEGQEVKPKSTKHHPHKPLMPVIITRDELQKKVYGAGYPSLPVMTVEEFYDQRVRDGEFPDPSAPKPKALQDYAAEDAAAYHANKEDELKEELVECDDPDMLRQKRDLDDYKDTHRRGFGNRFNRS